MSSILSASEVVELLARLKRAVADFDAQARALENDSRKGRAAAWAASEAATARATAQLEESLAVSDAEAEKRREQLARRAASRERWIERAHKNESKRGLDVIEEREGRLKFTLQKRALDAERKREKESSDAARRLEECRKSLSVLRDSFGHLEAAAARAFRGVREFRALLGSEAQPASGAPAGDENELLSGLIAVQEQVELGLGRFRRNLIMRLFAAVPLWLALGAVALLYMAVLFVLPYVELPGLPKHLPHVLFGVLEAGILLAYFGAKHTSRAGARMIAEGLVKARLWQAVCADRAEECFQGEGRRITAEWQTANDRVAEEWRQMLRESEEARANHPAALSERRANALRRHSELQAQRLARAEREKAERNARLRGAAEEQIAKETAARDNVLRRLEDEYASRKTTLQNAWREVIDPLWHRIAEAQSASARLFPDWSDPVWARWTPPETFQPAARFGRIEVRLSELAGVSLDSSILPVAGREVIQAPAALVFPLQGSLLFEAKDAAGFDQALEAMHSVIFRLFAGSPPGKVECTFLDPGGLGQNFARFMHLADYEQNPIGDRVWTQTQQIEEKLAELNDHIEKVIQMYLRDEYPTIAEYNQRAGIVAEKNWFVAVAGFPLGFSETALRRLLKIAVSGPRCGVYPLVLWDQRLSLPQDFVPEQLRESCIRVLAGREGCQLAAASWVGVRLELDAPPTPQWAATFLRKVGEAARDANRVELPFSQVAPGPEEQWSRDTLEELRVGIGRSGASKTQELVLGRGTRQHGLVAGKTGSGKSNLFHVIITNLALWCSPEQVEFYLVDFKKGVEFKCYGSHRLPHAKVVAIESDREFGLSVLQRVDEELRRRGELFREADVQDLAGYRKATQQALPRVMLIIDEFQEFFTEEDRIAQGASLLLDRIVRQGRAFGVHVLLGSQTLGGAYTLARATIHQMGVRIALQCDEADAYLIMDENNAAPRLLSRPGEGIYNDAAGSVEGNNPFQTVWCPDHVRDDRLTEIRARADARPSPSAGPLVFEGNTPGNILENASLAALLKHAPKQWPKTPRAWIGAPNAIKGPTEVTFQNQTAANMLVVGQDQEAAFGILAVTLATLAAQDPDECARFVLIDSTAPETRERRFLDDLVRAVQHPVIRPTRHELPESLHALASELSRPDLAATPPHEPVTFIFVANLQDLRQLKQEDEFSFSASTPDRLNPAADFLTLITEGPARGVHTIVNLDTYNNVTRFLGRKALSEFQWRVLFQMSASDSAGLIDTPDAGKLGLHRALLYNDREGYQEKFRPYYLEDMRWLDVLRS